MFRKIFCGIVLIAAALAARPWATAAPPPDEMLPFEVRLEGFADPKFNPDGTVDNKELAFGVATHLGVVVWVSEEHATPNKDGTLGVEGEFVLTGANGDQVIGRYCTTGKIIAFPMARFEGEFWITGGTGRFANAAGSGTIIGDGSLVDPYEIVGSLSGTISQPND